MADSDVTAQAEASKPRKRGRPSGNATALKAMERMASALERVTARLDAIESRETAAPAAEPTRAQQTRAAFSRDATDRDSQNRVMPDNVLRTRTHVNARNIPGDKRYYWVRELLLNQPDDNNMVDHMGRGWKPVPADRHPELIPPPLPGREDERPTVIRRGGLILMEKPESEVRAIEEERRRENMETMMAIAAVTSSELQEDSRMPFTYDVNQTTVERVRSFRE